MLRYLMIAMLLMLAGCRFSVPDQPVLTEWLEEPPVSPSTASRSASSQDVNHQLWQTLLDELHGDIYDYATNQFAYSKVTPGQRQQLAGYLTYLQQQVDPRLLSRPARLAYWLNLYNARLLQQVLDSYPVESPLTIRQHWLDFDGPWDDTRVSVVGKSLGLSQILHGILRPGWRDPRIHFVVYCACRGGPGLLPQALTETTVEAQLVEASFHYLEQNRGMQWVTEASVEEAGADASISQQKTVLSLSRLFSWYEEDFAGQQAAIVRFLLHYAPVTEHGRLAAFKGRVTYHYDWQLNDQIPGESAAVKQE